MCRHGDPLWCAACGSARVTHAPIAMECKAKHARCIITCGFVFARLSPLRCSRTAEPEASSTGAETKFAELLWSFNSLSLFLSLSLSFPLGWCLQGFIDFGKRYERKLLSIFFFCRDVSLVSRSCPARKHNPRARETCSSTSRGYITCVLGQDGMRTWCTSLRPHIPPLAFSSIVTLFYWKRKEIRTSTLGSFWSFCLLTLWHARPTETPRTTKGSAHGLLKRDGKAIKICFPSFFFFSPLYGMYYMLAIAPNTSIRLWGKCVSIDKRCIHAHRKKADDESELLTEKERKKEHRSTTLLRATDRYWMDKYGYY